MPTISIGDLTATEQINVASDKFLAKNGLGGLQSSVSNLLAALPATLPQLGELGFPDFKDVTLGASFTKPSIPVLGSTLQATAGVNAAITLSGPASKTLLGSDDYDDIPIADQQYWMSFELDTLLDLAADIPVGAGGFGVAVEGSHACTFTTYRLVADRDPTVTLKQAITEVLNGFNIPLSSNEVMALPEGHIHATDISGKVKLGGTWTLPLAVNQLSLASSSLPFNQSVSVQPALALTLAGDVALTGEFNVRIRRSDASHLRIGVYKVQQKALEASFTASAGIGANLGSTDLINAFLSAVSNGADIGATTLSKDDLETFQDVLKDSINRSLSLAINGSFTDAYSTEAAMVYEVDVSAPDQATLRAIDRALQGDWTGLKEIGAKPVRNVIIETVDKKHKLQVNILGLYNYESVTEFVKNVRVVKDLENGTIVITDKATATAISVGSTPAAAAPDRLRKALQESFTATAIYKALAAGLGTGASFAATQDFVLYQKSMSYADALTHLNAGELLGVVPKSLKMNLPQVASPGSPMSVGKVHFAASCTYGGDDVLRFFFSDTGKLEPRNQRDLEQKGRAVLAGLLNPQDPTDQKRIAALQDDGFWAGLNNQPANVPAPYYSDWYDITVAWAPAIAKVGPLLAEVINYGRTTGGDPTNDATFMKKREAVLNAFGSATRNTHAANTPAFPICVMASLAGRTPGKPAPDFEAAWNGKTIFPVGEGAVTGAAVGQMAAALGD